MDAVKTPTVRKDGLEACGVGLAGAWPGSIGIRDVASRTLPGRPSLPERRGGGFARGEANSAGCAMYVKKTAPPRIEKRRDLIIIFHLNAITGIYPGSILYGERAVVQGPGAPHRDRPLEAAAGPGRSPGVPPGGGVQGEDGGGARRAPVRADRALGDRVGRAEKKS